MLDGKGRGIGIVTGLLILAATWCGGAWGQVASMGRGSRPAYPRVSLSSGYEIDAGWMMKTKDRA